MRVRYARIMTAADIAKLGGPHRLAAIHLEPCIPVALEGMTSRGSVSRARAVSLPRGTADRRVGSPRPEASRSERPIEPLPKPPSVELSWRRPRPARFQTSYAHSTRMLSQPRGHNTRRAYSSWRPRVTPMPGRLTGVQPGTWDSLGPRLRNGSHPAGPLFWRVDC
jgi:hypothetical protein